MMEMLDDSEEEEDEDEDDNIHSICQSSSALSLTPQNYNFKARQSSNYVAPIAPNWVDMSWAEQSFSTLSLQQQGHHIMRREIFTFEHCLTPRMI